MTRRPPVPEEIAEEAAAFVVDDEDASTNPKELGAWLASSPQHVGEYLQMSALWEALADPRTDLGAASVSRRAPRRSHWIAAAAATCLLIIGAAWWLATRPEVHRTDVGQVTSFLLADRSVVFLNADSRISVHYSDTQRRVVLHSGEAVFEVASDVERPFIVVCGTMRVTAVGTKFAVGRRSGETTVTLIEGRVVVAGPLRVADDRASVSLTPGQHLTVKESGIATVATLDARQVAPWRHRRLVFDSERLADVTAAFNRFNQPPILIEGDALRELRISGVFAANDPDSLLAFLRTIEGVEIETNADGSTNVRRALSSRAGARDPGGRRREAQVQ